MIALLLVSTMAMASTENFLQDLDLFRAKSLTLKTELSRVEAASARALNRALHWTPDVSVSAGRSRSTSRSFNDKEVATSDYWRASANFSLFRGGSDLFAASAANLQEESQKYQFESEVIGLENRVGRLLLQSLSLQESLSVQKSLLKLKEDSLRIGKERYSQGKIPLQELTKLELDLSQQKNRLRQAELEVEGNFVAIKSLFVEDTKTKDWPFADSVQLDFGDALSPGLKSVQLRADSAKKSYWATKLTHVPTVDLSISYKETPIRKRESREWVGSIDLNIPLWSKYATSASVAEAGSAMEEAENAAYMKQKEEQLQKDLIKKKIDAFRKNLAENKNNLEKSERLYGDMVRNFQLGRISVNDLFIEQNRRIESLLSLTESKMAFHEGILDACSAWGKRMRECVKAAR